MKVTKIYFDMDGVLVDFDRGVVELCHMEPKEQDTDQAHAAEMWKRMSQIDHYYAQLKPAKDALKLFNTLNDKYPGKCEILTGIPKPDKNIKHAAEDKREWIRKYLGEEIVTHIVYRAQKKDYAKDGCILIDDLGATIADWNECGGTGIKHTSVSDTIKQLKKLEVI